MDHNALLLQELKEIPIPRAFIQWKGAGGCIDYTCDCGAQHHVCQTEFGYFYQCLDCGSVFEVGSHVRMRKMPPDERDAYLKSVEINHIVCPIVGEPRDCEVKP